MNLSIIVAMTRNRVIGKENKMPWHLPADLAWFRLNTQGKPIIMGRKTFESIGRPLPQRTNIVLSRSGFLNPSVHIFSEMEAALSFLQPSNEAMLIGGGELFKQYFSKVNKLYLTEIQTELDGDTYFPEFDRSEWQIKHEHWHKADDKNIYDCRFLILERK